MDDTNSKDNLRIEAFATLANDKRVHIQLKAIAETVADRKITEFSISAMRDDVWYSKHWAIYTVVPSSIIYEWPVTVFLSIGLFATLLIVAVRLRRQSFHVDKFNKLNAKPYLIWSYGSAWFLLLSSLVFLEYWQHEVGKNYKKEDLILQSGLTSITASHHAYCNRVIEKIATQYQELLNQMEIQASFDETLASRFWYPYTSVLLPRNGISSWTLRQCGQELDLIRSTIIEKKAFSNPDFIRDLVAFKEQRMHNAIDAFEQESGCSPLIDYPTLGQAKKPFIEQTDKCFSRAEPLFKDHLVDEYMLIKIANVSPFATESYPSNIDERHAVFRISGKLNVEEEAPYRYDETQIVTYPVVETFYYRSHSELKITPEFELLYNIFLWRTLALLLIWLMNIVVLIIVMKESYG